MYQCSWRIIHNTPKLETAQIPINWWLCKEKVVYPTVERKRTKCWHVLQKECTSKGCAWQIKNVRRSLLLENCMRWSTQKDFGGFNHYPLAHCFWACRRAGQYGGSSWQMKMLSTGKSESKKDRWADECLKSPSRACPQWHNSLQLGPTASGCFYLPVVPCWRLSY